MPLWCLNKREFCFTFLNALEYLFIIIIHVITKKNGIAITHDAIIIGLSIDFDTFVPVIITTNAHWKGSVKNFILVAIPMILQEAKDVRSCSWSRTYTTRSTQPEVKSLGIPKACIGLAGQCPSGHAN